MRCVFLLLAFSSLAAAQTPARALIWGGGATPESATQALHIFESVEVAKAMFEFPTGYPRVVESASLAGLKPGFHVVLLGVCERADAAVLLPAFKAIEPAVYARTITATERACPTLKWKARSSQAGKLAVTALTNKNYSDWRVVAHLADDAGELVDVARFEPSECHGGGLGELDFKTDDTTVTLTVTCHFAGCTVPSRQTDTWRFEVKAKRVKRTVKAGKFISGPCQ